jgi:dTDP-glucose pyrophosphorylase
VDSAAGAAASGAAVSSFFPQAVKDKAINAARSKERVIINLQIILNKKTSGLAHARTIAQVWTKRNFFVR